MSIFSLLSRLDNWFGLNIDKGIELVTVYSSIESIRGLSSLNFCYRSDLFMERPAYLAKTEAYAGWTSLLAIYGESGRTRDIWGEAKTFFCCWTSKAGY